jgi:hypothetical protein
MTTRKPRHDDLVLFSYKLQVSQSLLEDGTARHCQGLWCASGKQSSSVGCQRVFR